MPTPASAPQPADHHPAASAPRPWIIVLGDLMVDVVLRPEQSLQAGTDVPGRVALRAGGSAANTARWLGRLGARVTLISAVGRDAAGRALAHEVRSDGVTLRVVRVAGARTGRIGVLVTPGGERSFVADRGAADELRPEDLRPDWFAGASLLHLPAYSLLGTPLGLAGRRAIEMARAAGALISVDLASIGPLLARGRPAALALIREAAPDLLFATAPEAAALLGDAASPVRASGAAVGAPGAAGPGGPGNGVDRLLELAPLAVVKLGARGAMVVARGTVGTVRADVTTTGIAAADTSGAGDAFDAGFILGWLTPLGRRSGAPATDSSAPALRRAARLGHRAARRQLTARHRELPLL